MSWQACRWAAGQRMARPAEKLVLWALAEHASEDSGTCWPSLAAVVEFTGLDRKTVIGALAALTGAGLIADTGERKGRTQQVKVYRLGLETVPKKEPLGARERVPKAERYQERNSTGNGSKESQKRDTEPVREPNPQKSSTSSGSRVTRKTRLPEHFEPVMAGKTAAIVDAWPPGKLEDELDAFRDHHTATAKTSADWQASWRTWVANRKRWDAQHEQNHRSRPSGPLEARRRFRESERPRGLLGAVIDAECDDDAGVLGPTTRAAIGFLADRGVTLNRP
jgi:pyocin large subunit-like protein